MKEIIETNNYARLEIVVDGKNPEDTYTHIENKCKNKGTYSLILALRNAEKEIFEEAPELKILDLLTENKIIKVEKTGKKIKPNNAFIDFIKKRGKKDE